jgi:hypothetical protein
MPIAPAWELERELFEKDNELWDTLSRIKQAAWDILSTPAIPWYTDHGKTHSERVARHIFEILKPLHGAERLTPPELFVLLAACYLHDIGMWDLRLEEKTYPYSPQDYEEIRARHPRRSAEMIGENTAYLRNPDRVINLHIPPDMLDAIIAVSESHGSEYFEACVEELATKISTKHGKPFRGPFLAALLLMGDELDLEEVRAQSCLDPIASSLAAYPPESILHIYRHHYITAVEILHDLNPARIHLTFQFPQNSDVFDYDADMINWVAAKLRRQCRRTQKIFAAHGLGWDVVIAVKRTPDNRGTRKPLPPEARPHLKEMTSSRKVVNREEMVTLLKTYLDGGIDSSQALLVCGAGDSDCETLAEWLRAACAVRKEINWDYLDISSLETSDPMHIQEKIVNLGDPEKTGIFVLSNLHQADIQLQTWAFGPELTGLLRRSGARPLAVVMFADQDLQPPDQGLIIKTDLPGFTEAQVRHHLEEKLGCPDSQLNIAAIGVNPGHHSSRYIVRTMEDYQNTWIVAS